MGLLYKKSPAIKAQLGTIVRKEPGYETYDITSKRNEEQRVRNLQDESQTQVRQDNRTPIQVATDKQYTEDVLGDVPIGAKLLQLLEQPETLGKFSPEERLEYNKIKYSNLSINDKAKAMLSLGGSKLPSAIINTALAVGFAPASTFSGSPIRAVAGVANELVNPMAGVGTPKGPMGIDDEAEKFVTFLGVKNKFKKEAVADGVKYRDLANSPANLAIYNKLAELERNPIATDGLHVLNKFDMNEIKVKFHPNSNTAGSFSTNFEGPYPNLFQRKQFNDVADHSLREVMVNQPVIADRGDLFTTVSHELKHLTNISGHRIGPKYEQLIKDALKEVEEDPMDEMLRSVFGGSSLNEDYKYISQPTEVMSFVGTNMRDELKKFGFINNVTDVISPNMIKSMMQENGAITFRRYHNFIKSPEAFAKLMNVTPYGVAPVVVGKAVYDNNKNNNNSI